MKKACKRKETPKMITAAEFDRMADEGEDITPYLDLKHPIVTKVRRVNVDFPDWMVQRLDQEAVKLNISRQAVIKTWLRERLDPNHRMTR